MSQTLKLEISDETYRALTERASREGKTPAELSAEIVNRSLENLQDDPLEKFIGKIEGDISVWADRHDELLGEQLAREIRGGTE
jgi:predicted DNA-binding protein